MQNNKEAYDELTKQLSEFLGFEVGFEDDCLPPVIKAPCANCSGREPYFLSDSCSGTI